MRVVKILSRIWPIIILTGVVFAFFLPLFWPIPQIFVTPDSILSDILHFNLPLKHFLAESLKQNQLPVWTDLIGTGFPLIGEAEIGAFSITNLILFRFLPFPLAFNMGYVVTFLLFILGMYAVGRELGWSKITSVFIAFIFTFSGFNIVQIPHYNHLQAFSYAPFIFWILLKTIKNPHSKWILLAPFLLSQQIFQGHYQYVFMTWVAYSIYSIIFYLWPLNENQELKIQFIRTWITILILSLGIATIQLAPSFEFFQRSGRQSIIQLDTPVKTGGYLPSHLIQFFIPYGLGDLRKGAFPIEKYLMTFWETFTYIGIIPVLLALFSLFSIQKNRLVRNLWIIIALLYIFVFEQNSPFYVLFTLAPLSWFRIHSRFLAFITFFLVLLVGYVLERLYKKSGRYRSIFFIVVFLSGLDVLFFSSSYNPIMPVDTVLQKPPILSLLKRPGRLSFIESTNQWFDMMYSEGWKDPSVYIQYLNGGLPNYYMLHHVATFPVYSGFMLKKQAQVISRGFNHDSDTYSEKEKIASLSASAITTLRLQAVSYISSPFDLTNKELINRQRIIYKNNPSPFWLYEVADRKDQYYLSYRPKILHTVEEYIEAVNQPDALQQFDAFITTDKIPPTVDNPSGSISVLTDADTEKRVRIQTDADTFFVASEYLYPGWNADIDGNVADIIPANLSGMAVFVPKGDHILTLKFISKSLFVGTVISALACLIYVIFIIRSLFQAPI